MQDLRKLQYGLIAWAILLTPAAVLPLADPMRSLAGGSALTAVAVAWLLSGIDRRLTALERDRALGGEG